MKILQVNCVYRTGSTGSIMYDIHQHLEEVGIESVICYGRGKRTNDPNVFKTCGELYSKANNLLSRFTGIMYGGCALSTARLIAIIKQQKPDVVHLQCINGYFVNIYRLIAFLNRAGIRTVLTLHAEFMYTANCGHALDCDQWKTGCGHCPRCRKETMSYFGDHTATSWKRMYQAFEGFGDRLTVVSVSPWLQSRAEASPILAPFRHTTILNGLDTGIFHVESAAAEALRKKWKIGNRQVVMHVTSHFSIQPEDIKGGHYLFELAQLAENRERVFFVIGNRDKSIVFPPNVIDVGRVEDAHELAAYYSMADATLLTSRKETFSMVCAESLCCGTPMVGFEAGAPELISLPAYSRFVPFGAVASLQTALSSLLSTPWNRAEIAVVAQQTYDKKAMAEKYTRLYCDEPPSPLSDVAMPLQA